MPFKYLLPFTLAKDSQIEQQIPIRFKHLQVPFPGTTVTVMRGTWGIFIHQIGKVAGQPYSEFFCEALQDVDVEVRCSQHLITLHGVYKGAMQVNGGGVHLYFQQHSQSMHYVPEGSVYYGKIAAGSNYHAVIIVPLRSLLNRIAETYSKLNEVLSSLDSKSAVAVNLPLTRFKQSGKLEIERMKKTRLKGAARDEYYQNRISDYVIAYLANVYKEADESAVLEKHDSKIEALIRNIEAKPGNSYNVSDQAAQIGISEKLLERAFHEKLGTTMHNYVRGQRMILARKLLTTTNQSVSEIGDLVGYPDQSYFTRIFKNETGYTPSIFRLRLIDTDWSGRTKKT